MGLIGKILPDYAPLSITGCHFIVWFQDQRTKINCFPIVNMCYYKSRLFGVKKTFIVNCTLFYLLCQ